jgi:hypothetical protein
MASGSVDQASIFLAGLIVLKAYFLDVRFVIAHNNSPTELLCAGRKPNNL